MKTEHLIAAIIDKFVDKYHEARTNVLDDEHTARTTANGRFIDEFEAHGRDMIAPLVQAMLAGGKMPDELAPMLASMAGPEGFSASTEIVGAVAAIAFVIVQTLIQPLLQDPLNDQWSRFKAVPLSPAEVALNELRGGTYKGSGAGEAGLSGLNGERYGAILENTGEPISIQEALFLLRRGKIGAGDVEKAVRQSRVRDEWLGAVMDLAYGPPTAAAAIDGAVRGFIDDGTAQQIVAENGIDPANYGWLRESAGRPPGAEQMITLLRRGLVDEGTVVQAIRESDIKNKYIPAILGLRTHLLPERSVVAAYHRGGYTAAQAQEKLSQLGLAPDDIAAVLAEGTATKTAAQRDLSVAQISRAYSSGLISRTDAHARLVGLRYDDTEAELILTLVDDEDVTKAQEHAVTGVRARMVAHQLSASQAQADLVNLGVPGARAAQLVAVWSQEAAANVAEITVAELKWAVKNGVITDQSFLARLANRGYSPVDAQIMLQHAHGTTTAVAGG